MLPILIAGVVLTTVAVPVPENSRAATCVQGIFAAREALKTIKADPEYKSAANLFAARQTQIAREGISACSGNDGQAELAELSIYWSEWAFRRVPIK